VTIKIIKKGLFKMNTVQIKVLGPDEEMKLIEKKIDMVKNKNR